MLNSAGAAATLKRRLFRVIAPISLALVIVTAIVVIIGARFLIFPLYAETVSLLLENLAANLERSFNPENEIKKYLSTPIGKRKFCYLVGSSGKVLFQDETVDAPEPLLRRALTLLAPDRKSAVQISGFGPTLRLLGVTRMSRGRFLVVTENWRSFAGSYLIVYLSGLFLVLIGGTLATSGCLWLIFSPIWSRMRELENALREYGRGQRKLELPLDEKCAADGFLLVNFEFNRMADAIATLDDEKKERERDERAWIAGLAHDINTPMTIIRGYAENLAEYGAFSESPEQLRYLSEILAQSLYMQALVDDLLTQASTRLTPLTITPEWVELSGFYDLIIDMFHFPAAARGIALIAEDNGLKVWVDPLRLRQILINLVRNALTHAGHLKCIELLAECCDGGVMLVVQDDGSGIEAGSETAIFTCGKRGEHSGVKGWGLGLAVVKMLTEAHNGYCRVAVGPQGGARFELWFPKKMVSLEES